jgi:putative DNA methylase
MLKRLIEVALPLKEVSEQSAREKRQLSALHLWWARRPLPICRAAVFASLIPDPDDTECPDGFRRLVIDLLSGAEFRPQADGTNPIPEDTPRNRCLEFIKQLIRWDNSHKPQYIEPARKLIAAAHPFLKTSEQGVGPTVLDPFAGGGAIPLEALRLGCHTYAVDINPIAHLIELCTLVYPQRYGVPSLDTSIPQYIAEQIRHNRRHTATASASLFEGAEAAVDATEVSYVPKVNISETEYRTNPLAADVKYWGHWVINRLQSRIGERFRNSSGTHPVICYWWAKTIACPNPSCRAEVPLLKSLWLSKKAGRFVTLRMTKDAERRTYRFEIVQGQALDFDPEGGTVQRGSASCPFCSTIIDGETLRKESIAKRVGQRLLVVIENNLTTRTKQYRLPTAADVEQFEKASGELAELKVAEGEDIVPQEMIPSDRPAPNSRGLSAVVRYGLTKFADLFNARQSLVLVHLIKSIREAIAAIQTHHDPEYAACIGAYLAILIDKHADYNSVLQWWHASNEQMAHTFSRQALSVVWDYCEVNPFNGSSGGLDSALSDVLSFPPLRQPLEAGREAVVMHGSATRLAIESGSVSAVVTDPPYYDSVPYSDLSDFFYVWIKRVLASVEGLKQSFRPPVTPKAEELIAYYGSGKRLIQKTPQWYEEGMRQAFAEIRRVLHDSGIACVMFAHRTTTAWESLIGSLLQAGLTVSASWPVHTEMMTRMVARDAAALASSVTLVCRSRQANASNGLWDDVRRELQINVKERLSFFWSQGIRGADFFISAIGPALSVFGKYERVTKLSGDEVSVGQFLDEVRGLVTNFALSKILKTSHTGNIDPESQFYVVWKWSYGDAKVPADESFKLAQALGMPTDIMWDRTGVLERSGENVQAVPIEKRKKIKDLGDKGADGSFASLIDVLHRLCVYREKSDNEGMAEFLARSGHGQNPALWLVAQAVSEILLDGDKEKQLMQGLLNQRDKLEEASRPLFR